MDVYIHRLRLLAGPCFHDKLNLKRLSSGKICMQNFSNETQAHFLLWFSNVVFFQACATSECLVLRLATPKLHDASFLKTFAVGCHCSLVYARGHVACCTKLSLFATLRKGCCCPCGGVKCPRRQASSKRRNILYR